MAVTPEDWNAYYSALGRFLHEFSRMENSMNGYLAQVLADSISLDSVRAAIILRVAVGGQRLAPLRDTLKRLLRVTAAPTDARSAVDAILAHVSEIHYLRDRLMHNGALLVERNGLIRIETANSFTVREHEQIDTIYLAIDDLSDAADDLAVVQTVIHAAVTPLTRPNLEFLHLDEIQEALRHASAWRYKPSRLERVRPKSRSTRRAQKPQQGPSQA